MQKVKSTMVTETILSDDNERRFLIHKTWDSKLPSLAIIMLNPTPSESVTIDHTTLYILNNCVELGFGSVSILNLFSTINSACETVTDKENLDMIDRIVEKADTVVYAPGTGKASNKAFQQRETEVLNVLVKHEAKLKCIYDPIGNFPMHPLCPRVHNWTLKSTSVKSLLAKNPYSKQTQEEK